MTPKNIHNMAVAAAKDLNNEHKDSISEEGEEEESESDDLDRSEGKFPNYL